MKSYKVRVYPKKGFSIETVVQAKTMSDAKKLVELQYGDNLQSVGTITEVK